MDSVIISRHPATTEWIKSCGIGIDAPVITGNATAADVAGKLVYGNIPLHLAALAEAVYAVEFHGSPPRGAEYTVKDMTDAGAHLTCYQVRDGVMKSDGFHRYFTIDDMGLSDNDLGDE